MAFLVFIRSTLSWTTEGGERRVVGQERKRVIWPPTTTNTPKQGSQLFDLSSSTHNPSVPYVGLHSRSENITAVDNPPSCRHLGHLQKNYLKDAALLRLPRAYARHVQERVQAYAIGPFDLILMLNFFSLLGTLLAIAIIRIGMDNRKRHD